MADAGGTGAADVVIQVATATSPAPHLVQAHWRPPPPPTVITNNFAALPDGRDIPVHRVHQFPSVVAQPGTKTVSRQAKPLVICLDGTGNAFGPNQSNVLRFFELLDQDLQKTYYQPGIGTSAPPGSTEFKYYAPFSSGFRVIKWKLRTLYDLGFGSSIGTHVQDAYKWACDEYEIGSDGIGSSISIVGFSRGSYTARVLAAMILTFGLVDPGMHQAVPRVYDAYMTIPKIATKLKKEYDAAGYPLSEAITVDEMVDNIAGIVPSQIRRSSRPVVKINFTGVFDTVGEIGIGGKADIETAKDLAKTLLYSDRVAHAIAIDEKRRQFLPTIVKDRSLHPSYKQPVFDRDGKIIKYLYKVHEVWFAGVHSDVGGGYKHRADDPRADLTVSLDVANKAPATATASRLCAAITAPKATIPPKVGFWQSIKDFFSDPPEPEVDVENTYRARASNISLRWMVNQASAAGIAFSYDAIYGAESMEPSRPELRLTPHESYLHLSHPEFKVNFQPYVEMEEQIKKLEEKVPEDTAPREKVEQAWRIARKIRSDFVNDVLIPEAARLDTLPLSELKKGGDKKFECILADMGTQIHESRKGLYRLIPPVQRIFEKGPKSNWFTRIFRSDFEIPDPRVPSQLHPSVYSRYKLTPELRKETKALGFIGHMKALWRRQGSVKPYVPAIKDVSKRLLEQDKNGGMDVFGMNGPEAPPREPRRLFDGDDDGDRRAASTGGMGSRTLSSDSAKH